MQQLFPVQNIAGVGDSSPSFYDMDYWRNKVSEFQVVLDDLDQSYVLLQQCEFSVADSDYPEWQSLMQALVDKQSAFRTAAQAINVASQGLNAVGVQFPAVQIPISLGVAPAVAIAVAVAAAAALIIWAKQFWQTVNNAIARWQNNQAILSLPPEQQGAALMNLQTLQAQVETAQAKASGGTLSGISNIVMWVAIGFIGYKFLESQSKGR